MPIILALTSILISVDPPVSFSAIVLSFFTGLDPIFHSFVFLSSLSISAIE